MPGQHFIPSPALGKDLWKKKRIYQTEVKKKNKLSHHTFGSSWAAVSRDVPAAPPPPLPPGVARWPSAGPRDSSAVPFQTMPESLEPRSAGVAPRVGEHGRALRSALHCLGGGGNGISITIPIYVIII